MKNTSLHIIIICLVFSLFLPLPASAQPHDLLFRDTRSPITLGALNISNSDISANIDQEHLQQEYARILNIARTLGTGFNINIPVRTVATNQYSIAGFRQLEENWHNLTAGYSLSLIAQEIEKQSSSFSPPTIDLLVKDKKTGIYYSLNDISTTQYCNLLISR
ncbi:MAG: hypothetical protein HC840_11825 [Leptolyngbyaceae cyanobacterium RM2_2_4]|nr:hypothetical protein [Leptolyngbyaceae cyanobacterium RM2_2_4]